MEEEGIKKLYYSISEVAELLGEKAHVLRYWETEFPQLHPRKSRAGKRIYTEDDIAVLRRIQALLRDEKYTIAGARQALEEERKASDGAKKDETAFRRELLELRVFLEKLLKSL
ncbi:MerR family transcriptional regulator [Rhodocaloribacter litoris]|nr:MerR family transcriptional regulator [Rhodocaloribacter litoris]GIV60960.1 MAG: transcriptional regulator [Rhodothermaceae bacterium]